MAVIVNRPALATRVRAALRTNPVVALLGPRQCGKTTLARTLAAVEHTQYFDLEDPVGLARLAEPMTALAPLRGLVIIDEVQRQPSLFALLRVLADRRRTPARFLVFGVHYGVEAKYADAPRITKSMLIAIEDLGLQKLYVVYPGVQRYALDKKSEVLPLHELLAQLDALRGRRVGTLAVPARASVALSRAGADGLADFIYSSTARQRSLDSGIRF